jgi:hypothetical protein
MYMRGGVLLMKTVMEHIKKAVCIVKEYLLNKVLKKIFVFGLDLMTLFAHSIKKLYAWTVLNIKRYLVPQIIVEEYNKVEPMFANKQAGQIGRLLLITVPLTLLLVLLHLILGFWNVLVAMMVKLLKRG